MNYYLLASGILGAMAVAGHFTIGRKEYLKPVLESNIDEIPKTIMHGLFHYASVFMVLSTIVLLANAFNLNLENCMMDSVGTVMFIAITYIGFAFTQIIIALTSKVEKGVFKLFQWVFWILIAGFAIMGIL